MKTGWNRLSTGSIFQKNKLFIRRWLPATGIFGKTVNFGGKRYGYYHSDSVPRCHFHHLLLWCSVFQCGHAGHKRISVGFTAQPSYFSQISVKDQPSGVHPRAASFFAIQKAYDFTKFISINIILSAHFHAFACQVLSESSRILILKRRKD